MIGLTDTNMTTLLDYITTLQSDVLITFQSVDMINKKPKNTTKCSSYTWLTAKIGYMPVFTVKIKKNKVKNRKYIKSMLDSVFSNGTKYVYILDPTKLKCIDTDMYRWVDVHSIENDGPEDEDDERIKKMYDKDWRYITKIDNYGPIQTLIPKITKESVIKVFKF